MNTLCNQPNPNDLRNLPEDERQIMRECVEAIIKTLDKLAEQFEPHAKFKNPERKEKKK